jgi:hypothetical protein
MRKTLTILFLLLSLSVRATDYYVRTDGSNSNNGLTNTSGGAWLTVDYACSQVSAGTHTIHVGAGTFAEGDVRMELAAGVNLDGAGQSSTTISSTYTPDSYYEGSLYLYTASPGTDGNQVISDITFDGVNSTGQRGICVRYRNNVEIVNCTFTNWNFDGVNLSSVDEAILPTIYYSNDNIVHSCTFNNASSVDIPWTEGGNSISILGQIDCLVYDNVITNTQLDVGYNGKSVGGSHNKGLKIHDNVFTKLDENVPSWNFHHELWYWEGGGEIYNNTYNGAATIDIVDVRKGDYDYGLKIYNNDFLVTAPIAYGGGHEGQGIGLEERGYCEGVEITRNYFKNYPVGVWWYGPNEDTAYTKYDVYFRDITIAYNIFETIGYTDYTAVPILFSSLNTTGYDFFVDDININNNVAYGGTSESFIRWNHVGTFDDISINNNIVHTLAWGTQISFNRNTAGGTIANLTVNNNIFYNTGGTTIGFTNVTPTIYTHTNNLTSNPAFVSSSDFHLTEGSPAIDAGIGVGLTLDYEGNAVGASPDIGAYEYDSAPPDDPPGLPVLSTTAISTIWTRGATSGGNITENGGAVTARGVCWSTSANPTTSDSKTTDGTGTGAFTSTISPLVKSTTYHVRSYATNSEGTSYGADIEFTTPAFSIFGNGSTIITSGGVPIKIE